MCYSNGGGSGECQTVIMQYNLKTKSWRYIGLSQYPDYMDMILSSNSLEYWLYDDVVISKLYLLKMYLTRQNSAEKFYKTHFNDQFFKFINYFASNYNLENKDDIYEIYYDKSNILNEEEKNKIKNTLGKFDPNLGTDKEIELFISDMIKEHNKYN